MSESIPSLVELLEENRKLRDELQTEKTRLSTVMSELSEKNLILHREHRNLSDSINYARRIQQAILPPENQVKKWLPDSFVLYKAKDVVSGDFYFVSGVDDTSVFSAVDCTGHGVPGAMMSVIGFTTLDQAINKNHIIVPGEILSFLDEGVNTILRQTKNESGVKDGMDIAVCSLNMKTGVLQYAGAYNEMYYFANKELIEIKADKTPIGVNEDGVTDTFTNHIIPMKAGDTVYLFTDGFADQFGGPQEKKFTYKRLRELLQSVQDKPMTEQRAILDATIDEWRGKLEQVDDILIMGVKV
jgi:phosphoserine phosphatase RsbU/P